MKKLLILFVSLFFLFGCSKTQTVIVTYETNGGSILSSTSTVNSNSPQWVPLTPQKVNSYFVNWYTDEQLTTLYTHQDLVDHTSLTLYARYIDVDQDVYFLVSFVSMGGTFVPNQLVTSGELLVEPDAPSKDGYTFLYWEYVNSISNKQGEVNFTDPITEHLTVEAVYSKN